MELKLKDLNVWKQSLSRFQWISIIAIAGLVVINAAFLFIYLLPQHDALKQARDRQNEKNVSLVNVQGQYTNEKISVEQIEKLLVRVPVRRLDSDNLIFLSDISYYSQAPLAYVKQASGREQEAAQGNEMTAETVKTNFDVQVIGHLENLLLYIDNLYKYDRLYAMKTWTMTELTSEAINKDYPNLFQEFPALSKDKPILSLHMKIESYILPQFAETFK